MQKTFKINYTDELIEAATSEFLKELESKFRESILLFPEFDPEIVHFCLTTKDVAYAHSTFFILDQDVMRFSINPFVEIFYYCMGHELTHYAQTISEFPYGEQQCDLWTMARDNLFADISPTYIDMPMKLRNYWDDYKVEARKLFIEAFETGKTDKKHIKWIERELFKMGREN